MSTKMYFALLVMLTLTGAGAAAQGLDQMNAGLKTGAAVSQFVVGADQGGVKRNFQSLAGKRGLILLFTRSLDW